MWFSPGQWAATKRTRRWTIGKKNELDPDVAELRKNGKSTCGYFPRILVEQPQQGRTEERYPPKWRGVSLAAGLQRRAAGATVLKIAMFDEVNEATAMFKLAPRRKDAPDQGFWLTLDADGRDLPSDWYLRLASEITRGFHGEISLKPAMPEKPGPPFKP